jgi:hypothetical protein
MFKTESKVIGGLEYKITQLGVDAGLDVGMTLVRALGPALLAMMSGNSLATVDKGALSDAIGRIESSELKKVCRAFAEKTFVILPETKQMPRLDNVWDTHFAGRYRALIDWLVACVAVNFPDFVFSSADGTTAPSASAKQAQSSSRPPSPTA